MKHQKINTLFKVVVSVTGFLCFACALYGFEREKISWGLIILFLFTLTFGTGLSLHLLRSNIIVNFSDAAIFLCFLMFGGESAIILASLEAVTSCLIIRKRGVEQNFNVILFNFGMTASATGITFVVWKFLSNHLVIYSLADNSDLIVSLGILAVMQFLVPSILVALFYSLKIGESFWYFWKRECFSISLTQAVGACFAGIIYNLVTYTNIAATAVVFTVIAIIYVNYRRFVTDINDSMAQVETAEREKLEAERMRAEQAEEYNSELVVLLSKQEKISEELRVSKDSFEYAALHDSLTNLANRSFVTEKLEFLLELCKNDPSAKFYVLFLDLTRFKNVNDSLGHTIGDKILMLVAKRLLRCVNPEDTVARLGGDEFAVILSDPLSIDNAEKIAHEIYKKLTQPFSIRGNRIFTTPQIGLAKFDCEYRKTEEILRDANIAMHYGKEKNLSVAVFDKELRSRFLENVGLEADLRFAGERNQLSMYYQPLISLKDGELKGFEALLRWQHPKLGFVPPSKFIPIAEDSGLIIPITEWILQETCSKIAGWQKLSPDFQNLMVSVNLSGKHLSVDSLVDDVAKVLGKTQIKPETLKLEITETSAMENPEQSVKILTELKKLGVQLSIDDFGTGYSSLSHLHRLPFDMLKIDRSFVSGAGINGENSEILQTIVSLAQNLRMLVIAEGIETEEQLELLRNLGCDYGQGYLLAKPMPEQIMEENLYRNRIWFPESFLQENFKEREIVSSFIQEENLPVF